MKKPDSAKERNLIKGAIRRVFSRSELRRSILNSHDIQHSDPERPRVTKWSWCSVCGVVEPRYKMEVDHIQPVVPFTKRLEDMTWDELVDRIWCEVENLQPVCKDCHKAKTKEENKTRKASK